MTERSTGIEIIENLIWHDGPLLSLYCENNSPGLIFWMDCTDQYNVWGKIPMTVQEMEDYISSRISYRSLFKRHESVEVFNTYDSPDPKEVRFIPINEFMENFGPSKDSFLKDFDIRGEEAGKIIQKFHDFLATPGLEPR